MKDLSAVLPDGTLFNFWEKAQDYKKTIYVDKKSESTEENGSKEHPFRTIQQAADIAEPGTRVLIESGVYRETVSPMRGGNGPEEMITYEADEGAEVVIAASEEVTEFIRSTDWRLRNYNSTLDVSTIRISTRSTSTS